MYGHVISIELCAGRGAARRGSSRAREHPSPGAMPNSRCGARRTADADAKRLVAAVSHSQFTSPLVASYSCLYRLHPTPLHTTHYTLQSLFSHRSLVYLLLYYTRFYTISLFNQGHNQGHFLTLIKVITYAATSCFLLFHFSLYNLIINLTIRIIGSIKKTRF